MKEYKVKGNKVKGDKVNGDKVKGEEVKGEEVTGEEVLGILKWQYMSVSSSIQEKKIFCSSRYLF